MAGRALVAVLLTIGFYLVAIGLIVGLLAIPYFEFTTLHRINLRLTIFCLTGAVIIAYSILPTIEHFRAPGPPVTRQSHPRLMAEIEMVAQAVGEPVPEEVYLVAAVNAAVRQRGGLLGIGDRRVMFLGLPLFQILRVSELRAVLVHEFGHYKGHTQLAPWVLKTRESIMRTLTHLAGHSKTLAWPFLQYAHIFLSITEGMSRTMEFEADTRAGQIVGAKALIDGLRAIHGTQIGYEAYLKQNTPVYGSIVPSLAQPDEHFFRFMTQPQVSELIRRTMEEELKQPQQHAYDSHPPLAARIAALEKLPAGIDTSREPLAATLLDPGGSSPAEAGKQLTITPSGSRPWDEPGAAGAAYRWEDEVRRNFHLLRGWTIGNLPDLAPSLAKVGGHLGTRWVPDEAAAQSGREILTAALGTALLRAGWTIQESTSGSTVLQKDGNPINPRDEIDQLVDGATNAAAWRTKWTALGAVWLRLDALRRAA